MWSRTPPRGDGERSSSKGSGAGEQRVFWRQWASEAAWSLRGSRYNWKVRIGARISNYVTKWKVLHQEREESNEYVSWCKTCEQEDQC